MIKETLQPYVSLADMLARTFGKECEVVLCDLAEPQYPVIYAVNNTVTHIRTGESFRSIIDQILFSSRQKEDFISNYYFPVNNGDSNKLIRSSIFLIRKPDGSLDGALCINLDTEPVTNMIEFLKSCLPGYPAELTSSSPESSTAKISDEDNVSTIVSSFIDQILEDIPEDATREERVEKIRFMENKGIFLMKGSVEQVAARMGVNKVTIYSYLDEVHGKRR